MTLRRFYLELKNVCEDGYSADDIVVNEKFVPINHYEIIGNTIKLSTKSFGAYTMWDLYGSLKGELKKHRRKIVLGDNGKRFTLFTSMPLPDVHSKDSINEPVLTFEEYSEKYKDAPELMLDVCMLGTITRKEYSYYNKNF